MSERENRCQWCVWWAAPEGQEREGYANYRFGCRRNAPTQRRVSAVISEPSWPQTKGNDWCGAFKRFKPGEK